MATNGGGYLTFVYPRKNKIPVLTSRFSGALHILQEKSKEKNVQRTVNFAGMGYVTTLLRFSLIILSLNRFCQ